MIRILIKSQILHRTLVDRLKNLSRIEFVLPEHNDQRH